MPGGYGRSRFEAIFQYAPDAIVVMSPDGTIVAANRQTTALFGHGPRDIVGHSVETLLPERYRDAHRDHRVSFLSSPRVREMGAGTELFGLRADGTEFPVEISLSPLPGPDGEVMAAIRDVSDRVAAEARIRAMMDFTPDATLIVGEGGIISFASRQAAALFGHGPDALVGRPIEDLLPPGLRHTHEAHRAGFFSAPRVREMGAGTELLGLRADGSEFPVEISLSPLPGEPREVMAAVRDVTERRAAENRSQAILEFAPDATIIVDPDGTIIAANRQTTALFGHERDALLGMPVEHLVPERYRWSHVTHRDSFFVSPRVREMGAGSELDGRRADGTEFAVEISLSPLPGGDVMATIRDVTERRAARAALEHALEQERLAATELRRASRMKDEFLDIVAHELRTPLAAIAGFGDILATQWEDHPEPVKIDIVGRIARNATDMASMIERLLGMSRLQAGRVSLELERIDIADRIRQLADSLDQLSQRQVVLKAPDELQLRTDPSALSHIVTNFLTNAAKFSDDDTPIEVTVTGDDGGATITVVDHGVGIPHEDLLHVFEHFFQGRNQATGGRGVGVGLSVAQRYADLAGGRIWAESEQGEGSTFAVWLPDHDAPEGAGDE